MENSMSSYESRDLIYIPVYLYRRFLTQHRVLSVEIEINNLSLQSKFHQGNLGVPLISMYRNIEANKPIIVVQAIARDRRSNKMLFGHRNPSYSIR